MENNNSIVDKVDYLLRKSISKDYTSEDLDIISLYTELHSNYLTIGKVFGYSVSDYAFATLKWIGTSETIEIFNKLISKLSPDRIKSINDLIEKESYKQY